MAHTPLKPALSLFFSHDDAVLEEVPSLLTLLMPHICPMAHTPLKPALSLFFSHDDTVLEEVPSLLMSNISIVYMSNVPYTLKTYFICPGGVSSSVDGAVPLTPTLHTPLKPTLYVQVASLLPLMALWQVWYGFSTACYSVLEAAGNV